MASSSFLPYSYEWIWKYKAPRAMAVGLSHTARSFGVHIMSCSTSKPIVHMCKATHFLWNNLLGLGVS